MSKLTLKLSKPVDNGTDEPLTVLEFREPTGLDMSLQGVPVDIEHDPPGIKPNGNMHGMIAALSGNPPSVIGKISASDWQNAAYMLLPFFLPTAEGLSGLATNSQGFTKSTRENSSSKRAKR